MEIRAHPHEDPNEWLEWRFTVANKHGLHMRALQYLVEVTNRWPCFIEARNVSRNGEWTNAKSLMGLLTLDGARNCLIAVRLKGTDTQAALAQIQDLVAHQFHERE